LNLYIKTKAFIRWTARVTKQFLRLQAGVTVFVIFATVISRIAKLFALFLPLKVIILAGSADVPSYYAFIDPSQKTLWIVIFSIGALLAYALMLMLDMLNDRFSEEAGKQILRVSNQMSVSFRKEQRAKQVFSNFINILAGLGFVGVGALVLAWISPILLAFLLTATLLIFVLSAWLLRGEAMPFSNTKKWSAAKTRNYLAVTSFTAFIGAFLVILLQLLFGESKNVILAILGFIISRRILSIMSGIVSTACQLTSRKPFVDAILFGNVAMRSRAQELKRQIRELERMLGKTQENEILRDAVELAHQKN